MNCNYDKCPKLDDEWVHKDQGSYHETCFDEEYSDDAFYWAQQLNRARTTLTVSDLDAYEPGSAKRLDTENQLG